MAEVTRENWTIHDDFPDKYKGTHFQEKKVDCSKGIELGCGAKCCSFYFGLTPQDVEEGIVKYDANFPFMIKQEEDGYCTHLNRETFQCTIRDARPVACRQYSCLNDERIPERIRDALKEK